MEERKENMVLCGANSYEEKYYLNPDFEKLPSQIKDELKVMCVLFTEEVGGILTLEFMPNGTLIFKTVADERDFYYDEIETGLQISKLQKEKEELLKSLELYFKIVILGDVDAAAEVN